MFFRSIRERIDNLFRMVQKVEQTQGAIPVDIADLKRLLLARIAELESKEATEGSEAATSQTLRAA
jgi:iron-sulfur cluster repair protein YtfE (RIC family)